MKPLTRELKGLVVREVLSELFNLCFILTLLKNRCLIKLTMDIFKTVVQRICHECIKITVISVLDSKIIAGNKAVFRIVVRLSAHYNALITCYLCSICNFRKHLSANAHAKACRLYSHRSDGQDLMFNITVNNSCF